VQSWTFWSSKCSICFHLGWFVRHVIDVINPNSENITEVQWLQPLGWYSHWNIPSNSNVHSLKWTLNILFDINLVNAFIAWLIHANVLYWTFIHVMCTLHVLDNVLEILGLYKNNLLNSTWTLWTTFWTNFLNSKLVHEFKCSLISCILVWFKLCLCLGYSLKNSQIPRTIKIH